MQVIGNFAVQSGSLEHLTIQMKATVLSCGTVYYVVQCGSKF